MDLVRERWYAPSSSDMASPAYPNENHEATHVDKPIDTTKKNTVASENWHGNLFGADVLKSRRHSFGLGLGTRISKRRWRTSAEGPGSSTGDERIRNRFERHSVVY
jgi:hypothetical protein